MNTAKPMIVGAINKKPSNIRWRLIPSIVSAANQANSGFRLRVGGTALAVKAHTPNTTLGVRWVSWLTQRTGLCDVQSSLTSIKIFQFTLHLIECLLR
jgi:hypothetical protein